MKWMNVYILSIYMGIIKIWLIVIISNKNDKIDKTKMILSLYSKSNLIENHII